MAFTQCSVQAFDCLGQVHVAASVRQNTGVGEVNDLVLHVFTDFQGTGEDDPREWLKDALVALVEIL